MPNAAIADAIGAFSVGVSPLHEFSSHADRLKNQPTSKDLASVDVIADPQKCGGIASISDRCPQCNLVHNDYAEIYACCLKQTPKSCSGSWYR